MHSQSSNWTRNAIFVLAPLTLIALLAVFVGPSLFGSKNESNTKLASANFDAGATPSTSSTTAPTPESTQSAAAVSAAPKNLGTVSGVYTIKGPKQVKAGSLVVFVVDGKKRVVVKDEKAPYALRLKTTSLPNGKYTVSVLTSQSGKSAKVATYSLTINNKKKTPTTKPTATPSKTPTSKPSTPAGKPTTTTTTTSSSGGGTGGTRAQKVLSIVNTKRAAAGCKALKLNSKLTAAAQSHSEDMAKNNYFDHNSQDGRSPFDRMSDAGYKFGAAAENIAMGQQTPADVMDSWMNSAGHKANILNCTYTEMGLGYAVGNGSPYWTQTFGTPL
ncbi:CAP domain-containing protein [Kineosporia sp. NBRC 101731]|uniref:CAP domain-containing protein n=1 Tax=Kineosporia sp. NBRC 101731 TaxID=3032199 RepID=UPI0024A36ACB|nr:CAP domain-containing protein [Kineosporia sp. NBRC 101731]GLY28280.1 hypothetical protein Kisp02_16450 [Kineosporia sp. NBRC 101731]